MKKAIFTITVLTILIFGSRGNHALAVYFEPPESATEQEKVDVKKFTSGRGEAFADNVLKVLREKEEFTGVNLDKVRGSIEDFATGFAVVCLKNNISSGAVDKLFNGLRQPYADTLTQGVKNNDAGAACDAFIRTVERRFRLLYMNFSEIKNKIGDVTRGHFTEIISRLNALKQT